MLISLAEYAKLHKKSPVTARIHAKNGKFKTAHKIGRNWVIDDAEPWYDFGFSCVKYVGYKRRTK